MKRFTQSLCLELPSQYCSYCVKLSYIHINGLPLHLVSNGALVSTKYEGGVKGVRKPQNRTEKLTKTAIPHRILPKYRNRSKCGSCRSFHYKCDLIYSNNSVRCCQIVSLNLTRRFSLFSTLQLNLFFFL